MLGTSRVLLRVLVSTAFQEKSRICFNCDSFVAHTMFKLPVHLCFLQFSSPSEEYMVEQECTSTKQGLCDSFS